MMTLQMYREQLAPIIQHPVQMRRAPWLRPDALEWSLQFRGVLDAGPLAFEELRREQPEVPDA